MKTTRDVGVRSGTGLLRQAPIDPRRACHRHALSRVGAITFVGAPMSPTPGIDYQYARLTQRGFDLLRRGQESPHYPTRYLDAVRKRVQKPDAVALTYLNDSVGHGRPGCTAHPW